MKPNLFIRLVALVLVPCLVNSAHGATCNGQRATGHALPIAHCSLRLSLFGSEALAPGATFAHTWPALAPSSAIAADHLMAPTARNVSPSMLRKHERLQALRLVGIVSAVVIILTHAPVLIFAQDLMTHLSFESYLRLMGYNLLADVFLPLIAFWLAQSVIHEGILKIPFVLDFLVIPYDLLQALRHKPGLKRRPDFVEIGGLSGHTREAKRLGYTDPHVQEFDHDLMVVSAGKNAPNEPSRITAIQDEKVLEAGKADSKAWLRRGAVAMGISASIYVWIILDLPESLPWVAISAAAGMTLFWAALTAANLRFSDVDTTPHEPAVVEINQTFRRTIEHVRDPARLLSTVINGLSEKGWTLARGIQIIRNSDDDYTLQIPVMTSEAATLTEATAHEAAFEKLLSELTEQYRKTEISPRPLQERHRQLLTLHPWIPTNLSILADNLRNQNIWIESITPYYFADGTWYACVLAGPPQEPPRDLDRSLADHQARVELCTLPHMNSWDTLLTDFQVAGMEHEPVGDAFEFKVFHLDRQPDVLPSVTAALSTRGIQVIRLRLRPTVDNTTEHVWTLRTPSGTEAELLDLEGAFKGREFAPRNPLTPPSDSYRVRFDLRPTTQSLDRVVRLLLAWGVETRFIDLDPPTGESLYASCTMDIQLPANRDIEELKTALERLVDRRKEPGPGEPTVQDVEVSVGRVSWESAQEAMHIIRRELDKLPTWNQFKNRRRLVTGAHTFDDEVESGVDHQVFIPNLRRAIKLMRQVHGNTPYSRVLTLRAGIAFWCSRAIFAVFRVRLNLGENWPPADPQPRKADADLGYIAHTLETAYNQIALGERDPAAIMLGLLHDTGEDAKKNVWSVLQRLLERLGDNRVGRAHFRYLALFELALPALSEKWRALRKFFHGSMLVAGEDVNPAALKKEVFGAVDTMLYKRIPSEIRGYGEIVKDDVKDLSLVTNYDHYVGSLVNRQIPRQLRVKFVEQGNNLDSVHDVYKKDGTKDWTFAQKIVSKNIRHLLPVLLSTYVHPSESARYHRYYLHKLISASVRLGVDWPLIIYQNEDKETGWVEDIDTARQKTRLAVEQALEGLAQSFHVEFLPVEELGVGNIRKFKAQLENFLAELNRQEGRTPLVRTPEAPVGAVDQLRDPKVPDRGVFFRLAKEVEARAIEMAGELIVSARIGAYIDPAYDFPEVLRGRGGLWRRTVTLHRDDRGHLVPRIPGPLDDHFYEVRYLKVSS